MADDAHMSAIPENVPPALAWDFDFYAVDGAGGDVQAAWLKVRDQAPGDIFWTPRHGGHWVALRAEDIEEIQMDYERFSNTPSTTIPVTDHQRKFPMLPVSADPPVSTPFRALIMPAFVPKAVNLLTDTVRRVAVELIEELQPRGGCEFVSEFARILPVVVFLGMVDLPLDDRVMLQGIADDAQRSGSLQVRQSAHQRMRDYVAEWVAKRTAEPGDDLISRVCAAQIDGRRITQWEAEGVCHLLVAGGLDTVASMMSFIAWSLAKSPENRRFVREHLGDPQWLRIIVEELIRRHGVANLSRRATHDFAFRGVEFRKDDFVLIPNALAGLDEAKVEHPLNIDFTREAPIYHAAFGNGIHTCPGATLARREIMVFLQEWLPRIPEFEVEPRSVTISKSGLTNSVQALELTWPV